ncbi:leukocyte immunoglobulin-like receptor subfamily B member 4A isoform X2 [Alexandromys fortis]|uniref:leukocyte immunoglobulin-like receptor subfamily B member 4A isoform X2 n=1 Tax=Alexandromys fortis TaxID=100897 RepID=UPI00215262A2|nr:leukocyte immunoglobulin-like receptor subfamily B member 4A isoform X2 [Microtus fortis]
MTLMLRMLLCIGLSVEHKITVLEGTLPKPIIWAEPHSVIAKYTPVTIWCQGLWEAVEYLLYKEGSTDPWDRQLPLERENKAKFHIEHMSNDFAGIYKCYYRSPAGLSEHSDTLVLVLTGAYVQPSLSVMPSSAVTSGESITMQCSSSLGFDRFILIQEGIYNLSWTLNSQQHDKMSFQAHFVLGSVTANHNGTFRCYGYFKNVPQIWSTSSNPLDILVSVPQGEEIHQDQKVLIGVLVTLFLLFFLLLLLIFLRYQCKGKKNSVQEETNLQLLAGDPQSTLRDRLLQKRSNPDTDNKEENLYASVKDTQPEERVELDSWNPQGQDPQRIVYAQVKPSRHQKAGLTSPSPLSRKELDMKNNQSGENREVDPQATTSKEPQDVVYAQLCSRTPE